MNLFIERSQILCRRGWILCRIHVFLANSTQNPLNSMYSTLVCTEDMGDSKVLTFLVLDDYMADNQECRTSKWHYYQKLWWFTSSCFPHLVPVRLLAAVFIFHSLSFLGQDCYQEFLTAYWKWMNLKALKWHGFDCQLNPGKLTISCPPCPQPGINLPTGWESDPNQ